MNNLTATGDLDSGCSRGEPLSHVKSGPGKGKNRSLPGDRVLPFSWARPTNKSGIYSAHPRSALRFAATWICPARQQRDCFVLSPEQKLLCVDWALRPVVGWGPKRAHGSTGKEDPLETRAESPFARKVVAKSWNTSNSARWCVYERGKAVPRVGAGWN